MTDVIIGFVTVSIALGVTIHLSLGMYDRQRQQLEQARREAVDANQAKSVFLASMSHEIRTPINIMLGMNEMVLRERPSAAVAVYVTRSQDAGQLLLSLINDILDVSKLESGKMTLSETVYSTKELFRRLAQTGAEQAEKRGLAFSAESEGLPAMLWGDALHIRQIAANFLSNAVKYTESGKVTLTVRGTPLPTGDGVLLTITVTDTGIGIREAEQARIFEAFSRGGAASSGEIEGSGLGLAIARELTQLMGGRLYLQSEYGRGSSFTAELPQRSIADPQGTVNAPAIPMAEQSFLAPQGRVLVVDDNPGNLALMRSLLARTLLHVDTADSGAQALALVAQNDYHLILMDYMMPGMDGFETLLKIRESEKSGEIPIIYLTGLELAGCEARALTLGAVDFIRKPVEKDVLLARIALRPAQAKNRLELDVLKENRECLGGLNPEKLLEMAQRLTKTEFAVAKFVAQGYTNEEIGNQLCYSPAYVKKVVSRVFDRLDISRRSEVRRFFT